MLYIYRSRPPSPQITEFPPPDQQVLRSLITMDAADPHSLSPLAEALPGNCLSPDKCIQQTPKHPWIPFFPDLFSGDWFFLGFVLLSTHRTEFPDIIKTNLSDKNQETIQTN